MMGKKVLIAAIFAAILAILPMAYADYTTPCSDGTAYGKCSANSPGMVCWIGANGNSLVSAVGPDGLAAFKTKCACSNYPGYTEVNGACVKTTCTDSSGAQISDGQCVASDKPKQCVGGQIVQNSTACGCPVGKQKKSDGIGCESVPGSCRWGPTLPCPDNKECKFTEADKTDIGTCTLKQGCTYGTLTCGSNQFCDTSTNASGVCTTKSGCQYLNPACSKGQTCNPVSGKCEAGTSPDAATLLPSTPGGSQIANQTSSPGIGGLSCCCLPAAGGVTLVGLVAFRGMNRKEGEE